MSEYNGWTNYATWRVNLELFDGGDFASDNDADAYDLGQSLRGFAEDLLAEQGSGMVLDYALAFLADVNWADVNWCEIARHMIEDWRDEEGDA